MAKVLVLCIGVFLMLGSSLVSGIQIKQAEKQDLESVLQLDYDITLEFFKPLYQKFSDSYAPGQDPEQFLMGELEEDRQRFSESITYSNKSKLFCAYDEVLNKYLGFIFIEQINAADLELVVLMVALGSRGQGIGRRLFSTSIKSFTSAKRCYVHTFKFNNLSRAFYEKTGFKLLGPAASDKYSAYGETYSDLYVKYCYEKKLLRSISSNLYRSYGEFDSGLYVKYCYEI